MGGSEAYERPAIAGSGMIACGLAACATADRDRASACPQRRLRMAGGGGGAGWRASSTAARERVKVTDATPSLADCDLVVEAIAEDADAKGDVLSALAGKAPDAHLATTTSSLSIGELGERSDCADRFFGLHVFSPVARMELIELCLPAALAEGSPTAR